MFFGMWPCAYPVPLPLNVDPGPFTLVRQLAELTLVAVVLTLRVLELLYLVNALVDVPALLALHVVHGIHSFRDLLRQTSLLAQKTVIDA